MINIFYTPALEAALQYAGLSREQIRCRLFRRQGGLYELEFYTDWLNYDCYVDAESLQVLGFSFMPSADPEPPGGDICTVDELAAI